MSTTTSIQEHVRKEKTSIHNRLRSIQEDSIFVKSVSRTYAHLKVVANQRCGSWYVDPGDESTSKEWVYFKSTDGHHGRWEFSLRRANLHLLPSIDVVGGLIIVDSTRRGKRFPDALSKTIPIWCAVINTALSLRPDCPSPWNTKLYTSPKAVSPSEHSQIESRIHEWANKLANSSFVLPELKKPLRPLWISPDSSSLPCLPPGGLEFYPIICLSASKLVQGDELGGIERRQGYTYVQGSGDDHESWSKGLDPVLFWKHHKELLNCSPSLTEDLVDDIVLEQKSNSLSFSSDKIHKSREPSNLTSIAKVSGRVTIILDGVTIDEARKLSELHPIIYLDEKSDGENEESLCIEGPLESDRDFTPLESTRGSSTIPAQGFISPLPTSSDSSTFFHITSIQPFKRDKKAIAGWLRPELLDRCISFSRRYLHSSNSHLFHPSTTAQHSYTSEVYVPTQVSESITAVIICRTSTTPIDALIGVMMAVLQVCFDESGKIASKNNSSAFGESREDAVEVTKESLRTRLQWIQASVPTVNPSRAALKLVNAYFMSPRSSA